MNQAFFERAMKIIDNLTDEDIFSGLVEAGFDPDSITIRQYPELPEGYDPQAKPPPQTFPFTEPVFCG
jgi:hypothetical protein